MSNLNRADAAAGGCHAPVAVWLRVCVALAALSAGARSGPRVEAGDADEAWAATKELKELLWAFPTDTQTIMAARGPFKVGTVLAAAEAEARPRNTLEIMRTAVLGLPPGFMETEPGKALSTSTASVVIQGSKRFRSPIDLGAVHYAGASVIRLENGASIIDAGSRPRASDAKRARIGECDVLMLEHKAFKDVWTYYIAQPDPKTIVCSTDRRYLEETLHRLQTRGATRAIPETSPEWGSVDVDREFWAVRHYDRADAAEDPTSPLAGEREANTPDEFAVGIGCSYSGGDKEFKVAYLSRRPDATPIVREMFDVPPDHRLTKNKSRDGGNVVQVVLAANAAGGDRDSGFVPPLLFVLQALGHAVFS